MKNREKVKKFDILEKEKDRRETHRKMSKRDHFAFKWYRQLIVKFC
jgi:hypothetical protein